MHDSVEGSVMKGTTEAAPLVPAATNWVEAGLSAAPTGPAGMVRLPPSEGVQQDDRVVCWVQAMILSEEPDAEAPLLPAAPQDAAGQLPEGWWYALPDGLALSVVGGGRDFGLPFIDLRLNGRAAAETQVAIRFVRVGSLHRHSATSVFLSLPVALASGAVPDKVTPLLSVDQYGQGGSYLITKTEALVALKASNLIGSRRDARFAIEDAAISIVPGLTLWFSEARELDCVLRLGMPSLSRGRTVRQPWPEQDQRRTTFAVGDPSMPPAISAALLGARPGQVRTAVFGLPGEMRASLTLTIEAVYRTGMTLLKSYHAAALRHGDSASVKADLLSGVAVRAVSPG